MLKETTGAENIGQYGFTHYTDKPTDNNHSVALVPQSMFDGWEAFCSCGEWRAFANFYDYPTKDGLLSALRSAHAKHCG